MLLQINKWQWQYLTSGSESNEPKIIHFCKFFFFHYHYRLLKGYIYTKIFILYVPIIIVFKLTTKPKIICICNVILKKRKRKRKSPKKIKRTCSSYISNQLIFTQSNCNEGTASTSFPPLTLSTPCLHYFSRSYSTSETFHTSSLHAKEPYTEHKTFVYNKDALIPSYSLVHH